MQFNLADLLERVCDTVPEREALVCGSRRLTFAELDDRATRLAHVLEAQGVRVGDHVALYLHNRTEYVEAMFAAFKLRAVPINVNYRYVTDELAYLFDDADVSFVIHEPQYGEIVEELRARLPGLTASLAVGDDYEGALAAACAERDFGPRSPDDLYILYTGGTTGMPKGVMWRQEDVFFAALGGGNPSGAGIERPEDIAERAVAGRQRCLPASPFTHGAAHWFAWSMLLTGSTVVVAPSVGLEPATVWRTIAEERVSFLVIVGDAFARPLADALRAAGVSAFGNLSHLTVILSGGAILSPTVKTELLDLLPGAMIVDGFGASETGGQGHLVGVAGSPGDKPTFKLNDQTVVLDDEFRPIQPGAPTVGRLARRGRVPIGYYKDADKTAATFPVVDGVRWAVPGDMATVDADGVITLLGRGSVSINTGGEKVYPEEVESCLKAHPAVFDAVVVGVPDERWGERVAAVVSTRDRTEPPTLDDVVAHCRSALAGYKLPRQLVLVDEVKRSPSGKADYRWARETAAVATPA